jgi:hypothetical protein
LRVVYAYSGSHHEFLSLVRASSFLPSPSDTPLALGAKIKDALQFGRFERFAQ